jgi:prepilin-type processing-associated H-X9-DG protein
MKRGFTWVELLVILLVLLVVGALATPVFLHVREASWRAQCLSHLRNLAEATSVYAAANNHRLPLSMPADETGYYPTVEAQVPATSLRDSVYWANAMMVDIESFRCSVVDGGITYSYNGYLHSYDISDISDNSTTILFWEGLGESSRNFAIPRLDCTDPFLPCNYDDVSLDTLGAPPEGSVWTHGRGANFLFLDGHAAWRRLGEKAGVPTDPNVDPFHQYDRSGRADKLWLDESGRAPLFKP